MYMKLVEKIIYAFFLLVFLYFSLKYFPGYPHGDAPEYILTTEAFINHASPNITEHDVESYIGLNSKKYKEDVYLGIKETFKKPNSFKDGNYGFFLSNSGKVYSYHFWFYSLLNVPARYFIKLLDANIHITFILTNVILACIVLGIIFSTVSITTSQKIILGLLFFSSPHVFYVGWAHPDFFAGCFVFISLFFFHHKKFYPSLLCMSIPAMQFPPLFIPSFAILIWILISNKLSLKSIVLSALCSVFIVFPPIFYYLNFGVFNIIVNQGFIDINNVNWTRFKSFFFDLNQGMIVGIPIILIIVSLHFSVKIFSLIYSFIKNGIRKSYNLLISNIALKYYYIGIFCVLSMGYFYLQMVNWDHEMSIVNRYVSWNAPFFIFYFFNITLNIRNILIKYALFLTAVWMQFYIFYSNYDKNNIWWGYNNKHSQIAQYLLDNHPHLYNPEPSIFIRRHSKANISTTDSVLVHTNKNKIITKMMVWEKGGINQLLYRGIAKEKLELFKPTLKYYLGWAYINKNDLDILGYIQENDTLIPFIENKKFTHRYHELLEKYHANPGWQEQMKKKAEEWNLPLEKVLHDDLIWVLQEEDKMYYEQKK